MNKIITSYVSREFQGVVYKNLREFNGAYLASFSRLSAASAFPASIAKTIRNSRSIATLKALKDGLESRGITKSAAERGVEQTRNSAIERHPKMQKRPSVQEERF